MMSTNNPRKVIIQPIIISKETKKQLRMQNINLQKLSNMSVYTDEVIYQSKSCDFLKGDSQEVSIVNRHNLVNKTFRTVARCTSKDVTIETTSDDICSLIGQRNYETVLTALSSIFNTETKVRGILALLKPQWAPKSVSVSTQVDMKTDLNDISCQTNESRLMPVNKKKKRLRRCQFSTYVVKESPPPIRKCIINIDDIVKKEPDNDVQEIDPLLPNLDHDPEVSNLSCGSQGTLRSFSDIPERMDDLLLSVTRSTEKDNNVEDTEIILRDGSRIRVPIKPQDDFHIATQEILKHVTNEERVKLIQHQAFIDFEMCLKQDEDGYNLLHIAVINDEVGMVRRQCFALRRHRETVDILAGGMTALHMAIRNNASSPCITALLHFGADPLLRDSEGRSGFHHAADAEISTLKTLLSYCDLHARRVLRNKKEFWKPELESKNYAQLAQYLYEQAAEMFDDQGYTPLMLSAGAVLPDHVSAFASRAPSKVDVTARCSGETALYRTVAAACLHALKSNNRAVIPEKFLKTVHILVDNGADPSIENHSGSSVNSLLTEYNISPLSMAIANGMNTPTHKQDPNMMLFKESNGNIVVKDLKKNVPIVQEVHNTELKSKEKKVVINNITVIQPETTNDVKKDVLVKATEKVDINDMSVKQRESEKNEVVKVLCSSSLLKGIHMKGGEKRVFFRSATTRITPEPKKIVKKFTIIAPQQLKGIKDNSNVRVEMIKTTQKTIKDKLSIHQNSDKLIIVENLKLNTATLPAPTHNVEPKNIIVTNPKEMVVAVSNRQKLKFAPSLMQSEIDKAIGKKRKLNEQ